MVSALQDKSLSEIGKKTENQIAELLDDRFGDGLSCHPRLRSNIIYKKAIDLGYLDAEGYLTRKGRNLINRYRFR